jgi:N-acetylmuramoyl-L-alanine amidase
MRRLRTLILLLALLGTSGTYSQSIEVCRERFTRYFDHKGRMGSAVRFNNASIVISGGCTVYDHEIPALKVLLESAPRDEQVRMIAGKGNRRFSAELCDSLMRRYVSPPAGRDTAAPLRGLKIAIDPGHFGNTRHDAAIEQKYLRFVRPAAPRDTVLLYESNLTWATAAILAARLREGGAEVFITRTGPGMTSFGYTYRDWLKQRRADVLDSLVAAGSMTAAKRTRLARLGAVLFYREFFRDFELVNRAKLVNGFKPDATVIIHYNVDEKNAPWKKPTGKNYTMAFVPGAFSPQDILRTDGLVNFLRWLLTDDFDDSRRLSALTVSHFASSLGIPVARASDATYLRDNCLYAGVPGVFCRNLVLCRLINSPLVYGESLYQDNITECEGLMRCDEDIYGVKTNERVGKVANCYYDALFAFFREKALR